MRFIAAKEANERMKYKYEMYEDNGKQYDKLKLKQCSLLQNETPSRELCPTEFILIHSAVAKRIRPRGDMAGYGLSVRGKHLAFRRKTSQSYGKNRIGM